MRKGIFEVLLGVLFLVMFWNDPMVARAEDYYWAQEEVTDGEQTRYVKSWYKADRPPSVDSIKLDGMPEIEKNDTIVIDCALNEEVAEWLTTLSGEDYLNITSFARNETIQIGSPENDLKISTFNAYHGDITLYGSAEYMRSGSGNVHVTGDVDGIALGDHQSACAYGTITISGNVKKINWIPEVTGEHQKVGFGGTMLVKGTVSEGTIRTYSYDKELDMNVWETVKNINECKANTFKIVDGVLDKKVSTTDVEKKEVVYRYQYVCFGFEDKTYWNVQAYNAETNEYVYSKSCTVEDIPDGANVSVYSTAQTGPTVINADLEYLTVYAEGDSQTTAKVVLNGNVNKLGIRADKKSAWDVTINGDVKELSCDYFYNKNHNVTVKGTVELGKVFHENSYYSYFTTKDMQILINGEWNPKLYMYPTPSFEEDISYQMATQEEVKKAIGDETIGKEVTVRTSDGETKLVKDAQVIVLKKSQTYLDEFAKTDDVKKALTSIENSDKKEKLKTNVIGGIAIDIRTLYKYADKNEIYYGDKEYSPKAVTELPKGNKLSFTIKIPSNEYDKDAQYDVVRHHENSDGSVSVEVLETTIKGDVVTFSSDKFSLFMLVKSVVDDNPVQTPDLSGLFATYDNCNFVKDASQDVRCYRTDGTPVINEFKCDGTYTYYFQADGTAMRDRLTYHPDGVHVIYFDEYGHEVFSDFANVKKTIAGESVDDYCFFDVYGYLYVDVVTYDKTGTYLYYANPYGVMDRGKWFEFSENVKWADGTPFDKAGGKYGYAQEDGTLMTNQWTYDWEGRYCYMQGNGVALY